MKIYFLLSLILVTALSTSVQGQKTATRPQEAPAFIKPPKNKPAIDTSMLGKWPIADQAGISNDGNYYYYIVEDPITNNKTLYLKADIQEWEIKIDHINEIEFLQNSKIAVFIKSEDSLGILTLGTSDITFIPNVHSFRLSKNINDECLAYLKNRPENNLVVLNLSTNKALTFHSVLDYLFSQNGKIVLVKSETQNKQDTVQILDLITLPSMKSVRIWQGRLASRYTFDDKSQQLAFIAATSNTRDYAIYYYKSGAARAINWIDNKLPEMGNRFLVFNGPLYFSKKGTKLLFLLELKTETHIESSGTKANVNIWNYKDDYLQSEQLAKERPIPALAKPATLFGVTSLVNAHPVPLNNLDERMIFSNQFDDYVTVCRNSTSNGTDTTRNSRSQYIDLISTTDGERTTITSGSNFYLQSASPNGKYVVWYDVDNLCYWSYDVAKKQTFNISKYIPYPTYDEDALQIGRRAAFGIAGWEKSDNAIYIYDKFDIWKVDPKAIAPPTNVTNGYGRKEKVVFGLITSRLDGKALSIDPLDSLLISVYQPQLKLNGFAITKSPYKTNPIIKNLEPFCYYISRVGAIGFIEYPTGTKPLKAQFASKYLVRRMNAENYPNWYHTENFNTFNPISDIHPEKDFNWLKTDLKTWKMSDGKLSQGILYLPENFDSTKKYPLILTYYEKRSDQIRQYLEPDFVRSDINIPYFVSNGYLIFVPDIYHKQGHNGEGVLNSVCSAADYLSAFPWVDSKKIGIQGHSFGGWETNFLVTHSNIFAAACEASGVSNQTSAYNQLDGWGSSRQSFYEESSQGSPYGKGVTPWTHRGLYIENSPVFYVDKVTTPLLIMHGNADKAVPFAQALEMFLAMKRANKKVWLLEYENAGHTLWNNISALDFTIRIKQFFDHYLKNQVPPKWMTEGVSATEKKSSAGLGPDNSGKIP